jgi:hypothetical protein
MKVYNEFEIESYAERRMDRLDRLFLRGDIDAEEYDLSVIALHEWTEEKYKTLRTQEKQK